VGSGTSQQLCISLSWQVTDDLREKWLPSNCHPTSILQILLADKSNLNLVENMMLWNKNQHSITMQRLKKKPSQTHKIEFK
jgi:hypothetical protein